MRPRASRPSASPTRQLQREHGAAGAAGDRGAAREVLQRARELAEEELRPAEEQQHLQPRAELLVVERRDQPPSPRARATRASSYSPSV